MVESHPALRALFDIVRLGLACAGLALAGCATAPEGGSSDHATADDDGTLNCSTDADCPGEMTCSASGDVAGDVASRRLQMTAPPPPCLYVACDETTTCPEGQLCVSSEQALWQSGGYGTCSSTVCADPCLTAADCPTNEVCRESGVCEVLRCDEEAGPTCYPGSVCEPTHAMASANGCRLLQCDEPNAPACAAGAMCDPGNASSDSIGCRRLHCDEPGALECNALVFAGDGLWECDPATATDVSGCVPVPCAEGGGCYGETYICVATSSAGRSEGSDMYGCIRRNCEEGLECSWPLSLPDADGMFTQDPLNIGYCDYDGPYATTDGCAARHCSELERGCTIYQTCDPESASADPRGCRALRCDEEGSSGCGSYVCDPTHPRADSSGCHQQFCEDQPGYACPEGTECNSRGANANTIGCAPPGDPDLVPVAPTPAATAGSSPGPEGEPDVAAPADSGLPITPGSPAPRPSPGSNGGSSSDQSELDAPGGPSAGAAGASSDVSEPDPDGPTSSPSGVCVQPL